MTLSPRIKLAIIFLSISAMAVLASFILWSNEGTTSDSEITGFLPLESARVSKTPSPRPSEDGTPTESVGVTPTTKNIAVPFTSQAPFGVWDHLHSEACEEASLLMAYAWVNNLSLNSSLADSELKKLVDWQMDNFGFFESTTAEQTVQMAREVYGLKINTIENPTREEIKKEIAKGNLVVIGMAGRLLGNPHFTPPGPIYHMLVVKGYDATGFFTNDPGTMYGANYHYSYSVFMNAAHDWTGVNEEIYTSSAVALVVSK